MVISTEPLFMFHRLHYKRDTLNKDVSCTYLEQWAPKNHFSIVDYSRQINSEVDNSKIDKIQLRIINSCCIYILRCINRAVPFV